MQLSSLAGLSGVVRITCIMLNRPTHTKVSKSRANRAVSWLTIRHHIITPLIVTQETKSECKIRARTRPDLDHYSAKIFCKDP
uniref:Uncharacterized protein n=1 Tax=Salmonella phage vB_SEnST11_KE22 TaxID=3161173 RepID=A0AAU8GFF7_9CAUD